jgi:hypothetical protein
MADLYHWYHIYADGQWQQPLDEHLKALRKGGLLPVLREMFVGMVGQPHNCQVVRERLAQEGVAFTQVAEVPTGWEQETMDHMNDWSKSHDGYGLYCHSKGAANPAPVQDIWRRSMTYYTAYDWMPCVAAMDDGVHTVGSQWIEAVPHGNGHEPIPNTSFFAGTFFWVRLDALRTLNRPCRYHRYCAEHYIGVLQRKPNAYSSGTWVHGVPQDNPCPAYVAETALQDFKLLNRSHHDPYGNLSPVNFWDG